MLTDSLALMLVPVLGRDAGLGLGLGVGGDVDGTATRGTERGRSGKEAGLDARDGERVVVGWEVTRGSDERRWRWWARLL